MKIPLHFERRSARHCSSPHRRADLPFGGRWTYRSRRPRRIGSHDYRDGEVSNVIFRFMSRFVFGHHATMDGFIKTPAGKAGT
jgi:hypothetical protein